jgi:outer membrane lipoprotein-sorting protein
MIPALALAVSLAASPSADEILARADAILAPDRFESDATMTTVRANGDQRAFTMHVFKSGDDMHRIRFLTPADDKGSEVLRNGDEMWNYLPNLKRALKISGKQEFHGGDFSNADVLRSNLAKDYTPTLTKTTADEYELSLKAKNDQVAYDSIKYWLSKKDNMPLRQEFYTSSGKLVRKLEFQDVKTFGKLTRPSKLMMYNMLNQARHSEMVITDFQVKPQLNDGLFKLASLGR